jgi:Ca2+-binding RTX toxin-like protein
MKFFGNKSSLPLLASVAAAALGWSIFAGTAFAEGKKENHVQLTGNQKECSERVWNQVALDAAITASESAAAQTGNGDLLSGGAGDDIMVGAATSNTMFGEAGADLMVGGAGDDNLFGDWDLASATLDWTAVRSVAGTAFSPIFRVDFTNAQKLDPQDAAQGQADAIYAGAGKDWVFAGRGDDFVDGGSGDDVILGEGGSDVLFGGDGADLIDGDSASAVAAGLAGDDYIDGGIGNDLIRGGTAVTDRINATGGYDMVFDKVDDDTILGGWDTRMWTFLPFVLSYTENRAWV